MEMDLAPDETELEAAWLAHGPERAAVPAAVWRSLRALKRGIGPTAADTARPKRRAAGGIVTAKGEGWVSAVTFPSQLKNGPLQLQHSSTGSNRVGSRLELGIV
jgi:hypothetical protein